MLRRSVCAGFCTFPSTATSVQAAAVWKGYTFFSTTNHRTTSTSKSSRTSSQSVDWKITFVDTGLTSNIGQRLKAIEPYVRNESEFLANYSDGLTNLPLLTPTHEDFRKALAILEPYLTRELEKKGVKLLATYNFPIQTLWAVNKLTSVADIKA